MSGGPASHRPPGTPAPDCAPSHVEGGGEGGGFEPAHLFLPAGFDGLHQGGEWDTRLQEGVAHVVHHSLD